MIKSMTAFGRAKREGENKDITIEVKSVNSRFFDCSVKIPRAYSFLEERIKNHIQKNAVSRAKVDVYVTVDRHCTEFGAVSVDKGLAESYIKALRELRDSFGLRDDISVMSVARNQDIFTYDRPEEDLEAEWNTIREVLEEALTGYSEMRCLEGKKAEDDIKAKIELVRGYADEVEKISEEDTVGYRDKLESRLRQILADNSVAIDENRLLTECAVWADKIAIDEELVRLRSHFGAFYDICDMKEPSGRKLDFLMQELNRETNTIGSKANNARIARIVVNMKGELEKIREQVQNIE
ncbi:MAG: YicC family protein [Ruminococcaceae bacterium]|nr:YicC family protein [Oscillospiraceae bacterium]